MSNAASRLNAHQVNVWLRRHSNQTGQASLSSAIMAVMTGTEQVPASSHNPSDSINFVDCREISLETFELVYRDLLEPAFPPAELDTLQSMQMMYLTGGAPGIIALLDDTPMAVALGAYHEPSDLLLLSYLTVRSSHRGAGIGATILRRAIDGWGERYKPAAIIAEIEDPRFHASVKYGDPSARLRFYDRAGSFVFPFQYFQPALSEGLPRVRGMLLICLQSHTDSIPANSIARFLDDYITACEGDDVRERDAEYLAMRNEVLSFGREAPLWPLRQFQDIPSRNS